MPSTHQRPAAAAAAITFLALVAGTASVPTAEAAGRVSTKFGATSWPASPATYGTQAYVNGKIKSRQRAQRVVVLQMKLPSGWKQVDRDKTNNRGRYHLVAKTNWYHKLLQLRVVVQPTRRAAGKTGKGHGFVVNPEYAPAGTAGKWARIAPGYRVQFNPCAPVRWRINTQYAPTGVEAEVRTAMDQLKKTTGIRFKYVGTTSAIPGSNRRWPKNTNLVVAWASPDQTGWDLSGDVIGRGGQIQTHYARTGNGKRAYAITRSGLVLDNTFAAPPGFVGPNARGSIIVHELGHVVGLGHTDEAQQQMYPSAENLGAGVYQAGDLTGLRHVGLMTGCLRNTTRSGRALPSFVPAPEAVRAWDPRSAG